MMETREPGDGASSAIAAALSGAGAHVDEGAAALAPLVSAQLRRLAAAQLRGRAADRALEPTALVHESFLRLVRERPECWQDRARFATSAAAALRRILAERARRRGAAGRGARVLVLVGALEGGPAGEPLDALALESALRRLDAAAPRQARVLELRCFGGLTIEEAAGALGVSRGLIEREWRRARAALLAELARPSDAG